MVNNKDGTYRTKLPSQFKSRKSKKKILSREGDKLNLSIRKCPVCSKKKMESYDIKENITETIVSEELIHINKCRKCNFINQSTIAVYRKEYPHTITYFDPKPLTYNNNNNKNDD